MNEGGRVHDEFRGKIGSDFIASRYALDGLFRWVRRRRPRRIVEVGPGIGTTTRALVAALAEVGTADFELAGIEHVPFCLEQMRLNLDDDWAKTTVVDRYEALPDAAKPIELLLIDGGGEGTADGDLDPDHVRQQSELYVSELDVRAVVFVENKRPKQRAIIDRVLIERRRAYASGHFRSWDDRPGFYIYQLDPTASERLWFSTRALLDAVWYGPNLGSASPGSFAASGDACTSR